MHQPKFSKVWVVIAVVGGFGFALISAPALAGSAESSSGGLPRVTHQAAQDEANLEPRVHRLERRLKRNEEAQIGQVFLRGGAAFIENQRSGQDQTTGYYTGAGIDLILSENAWGALPGTEVRGEIGLEFKEFDEARPLGIPVGPTSETTMLTVSVAPKLMFLKGASIRPWIIPVGLDTHVISPASSNVTYLDVGGQAGVGLQYNVWKAFNIGIDGRYHLAADTGTATNNNFGTVGGYIGASF